MKTGEATLKNTIKCAKGLSCLYGEDECLCPVEYAVGDKILFVECTDTLCNCRIPFGQSYVCKCPIAKEIHNHYKLYLKKPPHLSPGEEISPRTVECVKYCETTRAGI